MAINMKKIKVLFIIILFSLFLTGCAESSSVQPNVKANDLSTLIKTNISSELSTIKNIDEFKIKNNIDTSEGNLVQVVFNANNEDYIGFFQISKEQGDIVFNNIRSGDKKSPFDIHFMTSYFKNKKEEIPYTFFGGFLNDKKIKEMQIVFEDEAIVNLVFNENQESYSYARIGSSAGVKEIIARDIDGKDLYSYPPFPPVKR